MNTRRNCRRWGTWWVIGAGLGLCAFSPPAALAQDQEAPKPVEKKVVFDIRAKPWSAALEWLSEVTGLPVISNGPMPTGTIGVVSSPARQYTVGEVIDLINEGLLVQKRVLIRGEKSIVLVAADERIDPALIPRVPIEDLASRGRTEIVSVVIPLRSVAAEAIAPEIKKMLGIFGEVVVLAKSNQLVVRDFAGNLRRVYKMIQAVEEPEEKAADTFSYKCVHVRARDAARMLRDLLMDPKPLPEADPRARRVAITFHEEGNTVFMTGPADKIAQARELLKRIDTPHEGRPPLAAGVPVLRTYTLPSGTAEVMARMLQDVYKESPRVRIVAVGTNQVAVLAGPEDHLEIAGVIGHRPGGPVTELIPLTILEAVKVADILKAMFGDGKTGGPFIEADLARNAVIIRGSAEQVREIKDVLRPIGEAGDKKGTVRVFTLERGGAAATAEMLQRLLSQMRRNPVKVVLPGGTPPPDAPKKGDPPDKDVRPGKADVPVIITAFGNKLIVTSEDPEALALVQELIRIPTAPAGDGDFEVIRLKHGQAAEVARILDEAFNGPRAGRGAAPGAAPGAARPERIRVVADPATNSLLIKASPLDLRVIRSLLSTTLDTAPTDAKAAARTWVLGPLKYARATEVAAVIKGIYREGSLSMSVDERTNSLVLACSEALYQDIQGLVSQLEEAARKTPPDGKKEGPKDGKK